MSDALLFAACFLACWLAAGAAVVVLFNRYKRTGLTVWDFAAETWIDLPPGVQPREGQMTARDVDAADPLELLYLSNAYDPGIDRLRQAIRDEQQKGDQL